MPQTIGPFKSDEARIAAAKTLDKAVLVLPRDKKSFDCVKKISHQENVTELVDMAFYLPFTRLKISNGKINVGIAISGLLWRGGYTGKNEFGLKDDYKFMMKSVINSLMSDSQIQIHLTPHVVSGDALQVDDYELAYEIQKEEQRKTIEVTTANADIAKQEREIELKQKEVAVTEQSLEAEVKKKAEANKYAAQQQAEAQLYQRQKEAEARQFEAQRQAEAQKAQAEAMRYAKEQEAAGIRAVGEAEASAIQAKGIAEAEAMEKKAEAYAKYNKAAVAEMMIKVLPDIAAKVAEPLGQIDKITIIGGGDGENGVGKVAGNVPVVMAKVFESMKEATGIDLSEIINADSYDAKVNRNVNVTGLDGVNLVVNADTDKNGEKTEN